MENGGHFKSAPMCYAVHVTVSMANIQCQRIALSFYLSETYMTDCLYISSCVSHNRDRRCICYRIAECYLPPSYWLTIYWWLIRHNRSKIRQLLIKHWLIFVVGCRYHLNRTQLAKTKLMKYGRIYRESPGNHVPDCIHVKYNNTFVILTYHIITSKCDTVDESQHDPESHRFQILRNFSK